MKLKTNQDANHRPPNIYDELELPMLVMVAVMYAHLEIAPYTKVEESFNMHAIHDVQHYTNLQQWDHKTFPGAVPRSFVGSLLIGLLSKPLVLVLELLLGPEKTGILEQAMVRFILGLANVLGLWAVVQILHQRFGRSTSAFFTLFTVTQFHLPFYASRTLPNMFALPLVSYSLALLLGYGGAPPKRQSQWVVACLVSAAVIFRAEVAVFLAPIALQILFLRGASLLGLVKSGLISGIASLALTILIDTRLWQWDTWLWPELYSVYFNVVQGKSADWGVSPPGDYVLKHLPKLTSFALPLALYGIRVNAVVPKLLVPTAVFIGAMSCLGHKEWRFIIYVVPFINVCAAISAATLWKERTNKKLQIILRLALSGVFCASAAMTVGLAYISSLNYPGGRAMSTLHDVVPITPAAHVHICNLATQTGASLYTFRFREQGWIYNKTEHLAPLDLARGPFTHAIVEDWTPQQYAVTWDVLEEIPAYNGIRRGEAGWRRVVPRVATATKLWILQRK